MSQERPLGEFLAERHWTPVVLALVADIDTSTACRIISGQSRPRDTTSIRIADALGIGYERMRKILAATRKAAQASQAREAEGPPRAPRKGSDSPAVTTGPPATATAGVCGGATP